MFKYLLFICKCNERESHFDCHFDRIKRSIQSTQHIGCRKKKEKISSPTQYLVTSNWILMPSGVSIGNLSSLTGALKIHEILIGQDLVVKKKMLPNDPFYKAVLIKESRKKSTVTNIFDDEANKGRFCTFFFVKYE